MDMGEKIKALREQRGLSQEALAEALHVSRQAVTKWECGLSRPSTGNLLELCRVLEVPLETFTGAGGAEQPAAEKEDAPALQKRKSFPLWIIIVVGILCVVLALLSAFSGQNEFPEGVIGGADGPTAIIVTTTTDWSFVCLVGAIGMVLLGAGIFLHIRKKNKDK